jgi:hypothetical protein
MSPLPLRFRESRCPEKATSQLRDPESQRDDVFACADHTDRARDLRKLVPGQADFFMLFQGPRCLD